MSYSRRAYVVVGEDGKVMYSLNGTTWTDTNKMDGFDTEKEYICSCRREYGKKISEKYNILKNSKGFSIVELLLALPLFLIAIGLGYNLLFFARNSFERSEELDGTE